MLSIVQTPNAILLKPAKPVIKITAEIKKLVKEMTTALAAADNPRGIGLAAPQIGVSLRVFIIKIRKDSPLYVFINPQIIKKSRRTDSEEKIFEGCLSIPSVWGSVRRAETVTVEFLDQNGRKQQKTFTGLTAVAVQHETDHLEGRLFPSRILEQKGKLYQLVKNEKGENEFEEIVI